MKVIFSTVAVAILCCCMSCNNESKVATTNSVAQKNLAAMHGVNEAIKSGDMTKLGDYIATDAIDHAGSAGLNNGLDAIKKDLTQMCQMSKDMKYEIVKELADSEYVFAWMHFTGTNVVANMGMPAGSKYDMHSVEVSKFKDGKATEHWSFVDMAEMMKMMPPPPAPKMIVDTAKM